MAETTWRDRLGFLSPKCVSHKVGTGEFEQSINFYPVSVRVAFRLKTMAKPLAQAINTLFSEGKNDTGQTTRTSVDPDGSRYEETVLEGVNPELAKYRDDRRDKAIAEIIEAFTDPKNQMVVSELLMDSMRDDFPRKPSAEDINGFIESLSVDVLMQMLMGVAKANFGVLEGKLAEAVRQRAGAAFNQGTKTTEDGST